MRCQTALALALPSMMHAFARGARRLRRDVRALALAGGALPSRDRFAPNLVSDASGPTTAVLVLGKDEYDAWLAAQPADAQAYLAAAGFAKFKDDGLVLPAERSWLCYGLQEDGTSSPTLQKSVATVLVRPRDGPAPQVRC